MEATDLLSQKLRNSEPPLFVVQDAFVLQLVFPSRGLLPFSALFPQFS